MQELNVRARIKGGLNILHRFSRQRKPNKDLRNNQSAPLFAKMQPFAGSSPSKLFIGKEQTLCGKAPQRERVHRSTLLTFSLSRLRNVWKQRDNLDEQAEHLDHCNPNPEEIILRTKKPSFRLNR